MCPNNRPVKRGVPVVLGTVVTIGTLTMPNKTCKDCDDKEVLVVNSKVSIGPDDALT